jgi:hypothetical protein
MTDSSQAIKMAAAAAGAPGDGHELAIPDAGQAEVAREVGARGAIASSRKEEIEREHNERVVFGLLTVEQRDKAYALLGCVCAAIQRRGARGMSDSVLAFACSRLCARVCASPPPQTGGGVLQNGHGDSAERVRAAALRGRERRDLDVQREREL